VCPFRRRNVNAASKYLAIRNRSALDHAPRRRLDEQHTRHAGHHDRRRRRSRGHGRRASERTLRRGATRARRRLEFDFRTRPPSAAAFFPSLDASGGGASAASSRVASTRGTSARHPPNPARSASKALRDPASALRSPARCRRDATRSDPSARRRRWILHPPRAFHRSPSRSPSRPPTPTPSSIPLPAVLKQARHRRPRASRARRVLPPKGREGPVRDRRGRRPRALHGDRPHVRADARPRVEAPGRELPVTVRRERAEEGRGYSRGGARARGRGLRVRLPRRRVDGDPPVAHEIRHGGPKRPVPPRAGRGVRRGGVRQVHGQGGRLHRDVRPRRDEPRDRARGRAPRLGAARRHHGARRVLSHTGPRTTASAW